MIENAKTASLWMSLHPTPAQYPWLDEDITCDVAIIGGGITAAMCAMQFAQAGIDTVMISGSPIGFGSTASSSGMMNLAGEDCMTCLVDKMGSDRAMSVVQLMDEAMTNIEQFCSTVQENAGFKRMDSLRYSTCANTAVDIRREYSLRLHNGIEAELLGPEIGSQQFTFPMEAGIYSKGTAAQVDPYLLVHAVTSTAQEHGARVYENTIVNGRHNTSTEEIILDCATHHSVKAGYVIMAAGMNTNRHCGGLDQVRTTYMMVTKPINDFSGWRGPCMIHREGNPRLYLSVTSDNRILIGGMDSIFMDTRGRIAGLIDRSAAAKKRYEALDCALRDMFPAIRNLVPEYIFAVKDGRTADGLPIIGRLPHDSNTAYAFCCGENGVLYSEIASRLLLEQYQGAQNKQLGLFSPHRENREPSNR